MPDRTCIACACPLDPTRRADAKVCDRACYTWSRRHPGVLRPTGPQQYECEFCSETFTRLKLHSGKRPRFCDDTCWEAFRHRQRPFGEWRVADPYQPRAFTCADCGTPSEDSGIGLVATRCPACVALHERAKSVAWQKQNPARSNATKAAWSARNPDYIRQYWDANQAEIKVQQRHYRLANRHRFRAARRDRQNRRRALQAAVTVEVFTSAEVYERDQWLCGICRLPVDPDTCWPHPLSASLDHVIPLIRGGAHALANVQLAHLFCNLSKGASLP